MPAVLITGATGGIGRATVRALLDRGLTVYAGIHSLPPSAATAPLPLPRDATPSHLLTTPPGRPGLPSDASPLRDALPPRGAELPRDGVLPRDAGLPREGGLPRDAGLPRDGGSARDAGSHDGPGTRGSASSHDSVQARNGSDAQGDFGPDLAGAIPIHLDVTDPASVAAAAREISALESGRGLHAVVNNAGIIVQGALELVPDEELHRQFDVNVYGPVRVIREFLPLLRQARGRLINVTAPTARVAVPFAAPISASKAALAWLSEALRLELSPFGIPVIQVEPGGTRTEIFTKAATAERASLAGADPSVVALYRPSLDAVAASTAKQPLDPVSKATDAIVAAVLDRRPRTHYLAGNARLFATLARLPRGTRDRLLARTLGLPR